jgi:hypothetical protein
MKNVYKTMVREPEGKRPLARPRCMWGDNIGMKLRERVGGVVKLITFAITKCNHEITW